MTDHVHENDPFWEIIGASWDTGQETMDQLVLKSHENTMNFVNWLSNATVARDVSTCATTFMANTFASKIGMSPERYAVALHAVVSKEVLPNG